MPQSLIALRAAERPVYAVAGGNHVTLRAVVHRHTATGSPNGSACVKESDALSSDRAARRDDGLLHRAGVRVPDKRTPPDRAPPGPAELRELAMRWGIEFWTGSVEPG